VQLVKTHWHSCLHCFQVLCACLAAYLVHWFERGQRLRYKGLIPPAVAAMQGHIYGLPLALVAAQVRKQQVSGGAGVGVWDFATEECYHVCLMSQHMVICSSRPARKAGKRAVWRGSFNPWRDCGHVSSLHPL